MLARILRILILAWTVALAVALSFALSFAIGQGRAQGGSVGGIAALLVLVLAHPTLLLGEMLLMIVVSRGSGGTPIPLARLLRAWARECLASSAIFGWRMPWREWAQRDHLPPTARGRRGVVLLHGYVCNRALWNPLMARLRVGGHPFVALTMEPVFGGIDAHVAQLDEAVERLRTSTGMPPVVLAHSMGGLVARAWLLACASHPGDSGPGTLAIGQPPRDAAARVHSILTVGTPHRGTWIARFGLSPNARQMRIDGEWLGTLAAADAAGAALFTCWWSECDQVVYPPPVAVLPGARSCHLEGVAHVSLSQRPEIADELMRRLAE